MIFNSLRLLLVAGLLILVAACTDKSQDPNPNNNNNNNNNSPDNPDNEDDDPDNAGIKDQTSPADFLTDAKYKFLVVEVAGGMAGKSLNNFSIFLNQYLNKEKILIRSYGLPDTDAETVDIDDLKDIEKANRQDTTKADTLFLWIEVVQSKYAIKAEGQNRVMGIAYGPTSIAIFADELNEITLPDMVSRFTLETYILEHDFCHVLGLVNSGTAMLNPHEDEDHKSHCINHQCLMYWEADDENMVLSDLLDGSGTGDVIPKLDAACTADLVAAGAKTGPTL